MQRRGGILLHISSLPSPYGIGTMGKHAYDFVDALKAAGMSVWQVLPIGPTSYGDSPYQSFSTYAGNPYFIDIDMLRASGMLKEDDCRELIPDKDKQYVDYEYLWNTRYRILRAAFSNAYDGIKDNVDAFAEANPWLPEYALFSALKNHFGNKAWSEWPQRDIRIREPEAVEKYKSLLSEDIHFYEFIQYLFFEQWFALKEYANKNGISIFGDMPIYVAMDSVDTWGTPEAFLLDGERNPVSVAGVPPDHFTEDGQLWGNPLYNWKWFKKTNYRWWTERMHAMFDLFDIVRIDHFIGFANYYAVDADAQTARYGKWKNGPGRSLFKVLKRMMPDMRIVAEDLGHVTPKVKRLLKYCGFPGMNVLMYVPRHIIQNSVLYTGTHDNDTIIEWWQKKDEGQRDAAEKYLGLTGEYDICEAMIEAAYKSAADLAIIPMQDYLKLGSEARMNIPGTVGNNWKWRMLPGQLTDDVKDYMIGINKKYGRMAVRDGS